MERERDKGRRREKECVYARTRERERASERKRAHETQHPLHNCVFMRVFKCLMLYIYISFLIHCADDHTQSLPSSIPRHNHMTPKTYPRKHEREWKGRDWFGADGREPQL